MSEEVAELLAEAAPQLVALLTHEPREEPFYDATGESPEVDLVSARVQLDGTVLSGEVQGLGVARSGAWIDLDTMAGPAPDLRVMAGQGWVRIARMERWIPGVSMPARGEAVVEGDRLRFHVELGDTGRMEVGHAGAATAYIATDDRRVVDPGPAGGIGAPPEHALAVLETLAERVEIQRDPDLAVAIALNYGTFRGLVDPALIAVVEADAAERFTYGLELDAWLAQRGAGWRFSTLSPEAKLVWAWPAGQATVYGAVPMVWQTGALSAEAYRFLVPDTDTLLMYREMAEMKPSIPEMADALDAAIWDRLAYRASPEGMQAFCKAGRVATRDCIASGRDRRRGLNLGTLDAKVVEMHLGTSATWQRALYEREGRFVGDCSTATTLAMTAFAAVGIVPLAVGYTGSTLAEPTHDMPLYLDGDAYFPTQSAPGRAWKWDEAYVYATLPAIDAARALSLATEPGAWARGPTVVGGRMSYGTLSAWLAAGIPSAQVLDWVDRAGVGEWPQP